MTIYPSKDSFINEFNKILEHEKKYPLLTFYLNNDNKFKYLMKYIPEFNEFCNFMIDYYSYKISREDASIKIIKNEDIYINNENNFRDKFNKFIEIWNKLKYYSTQYGCREEMSPIDLDENKSLSYFLNDNGEIGKGMYIASAYQNFIEIQNHYLNILNESSNQRGFLQYKKK